MKIASVTLKDIAQALGLSTSTVSRALRDSYEINPETRRLVMEYAEKLHYQPNPIALSLKDHRSRSIGVIVPEIANTFFSEAINGIEDVAYGRGYHVVISQTHEAYEREVANAQYLASRRVDGLLVSLSSQTTDLSHFSDLHEKGWPLVFFDRVPLHQVPENLKIHTVVADNVKGAYDATVHLLQSGCRAIAHLAMPPWMSISTERLEGYRRALSEYGIPYRTDYVRHFEQERVGPEEIGEVVMEWMQRPDSPDAILGASDRLTVGCLAALKKAGYSIPDDLLLIGFTNLTVADLLCPALSAIQQPAFEMGQRATELLIGQIETTKPTVDFQTLRLETSLAIRESTRRSMRASGRRVREG